MDIDKKMLLEIFHIPASSTYEVGMATYIEDKLKEIGIEYETDAKGNIFRLDGARPFLNAHMDTVQSLEDCFLAEHIDIKEDYFLEGLGTIGGDDKCGIYIILRLLQKGYDINFAFTVEEEIGLHGSTFLAKNEEKRLKECLYGITLDRKGNSDIICYDNGYGTLEFEKALEKVGEEFGYKGTFGVLSDADVFNETMSCANLSVGYYNVHTKTEFVILKDLVKAEQFAESILLNINERFEIPESRYTYYYDYYNGKRSKRKTGRYGGYGYGSYYDMYDDDYYWTGTGSDFDFNKKDKELYGGKKNKAEYSVYDAYDDWEDIDEKYFLDFSGKEEFVCRVCGNKNEVYYIKSLHEYYCFECLNSAYKEIYEII